jgi:hypothetical protein
VKNNVALLPHEIRKRIKIPFKDYFKLWAQTDVMAFLNKKFSSKK